MAISFDQKKYELHMNVSSQKAFYDKRFTVGGRTERIMEAAV